MNGKGSEQNCRQKASRIRSLHHFLLTSGNFEAGQSIKRPPERKSPAFVGNGNSFVTFHPVTRRGCKEHRLVLDENAPSSVTKVRGSQVPSSCAGKKSSIVIMKKGSVFLRQASVRPERKTASFVRLVLFRLRVPVSPCRARIKKLRM